MEVLSWCGHIVFVTFVGLILGQPFTPANGLSGEVMYESQIIKTILTKNEDYVKEARPAQKANDSIAIIVVPRFLRIESINEIENTFTASIILIQIWQDSRLTWNKTEYGEVNYVHVPASLLWLPDIIPYNTAAMGNPDPLYEETAGLSSNGYIEWGPILTIAAECPMDVQNFPFDTQTCTMMFGSWLHSNAQINLKFLRTNATEKDILLTDTNLPFVRHPSWDLVGEKVKAKIEDIKYGNSHFSVLSMTAKVERRASFYKYLAIGPGALLGLLVPVLFLLPPKSQEKNTFGILIILGLILLVSVLADSTPLNHANTPRMGVFYLITMVLVIISLVLSIIVSNLSFRGSSRSPIPQWIHTVFLKDGILRKILCMSTSSPMKSIYANFQSPEDFATSNPETDGASMTDQGEKPENKNISNYLRFICDKLSADDAYRNVNQDWTEMARVLDRLLFVIFFIIYVVTAVALLT